MPNTKQPKTIKINAFDKIGNKKLFIHDIRFTKDGEIMDFFCSETNIIDDALWFNHFGVELKDNKGIVINIKLNI